MDGDGDGDGAVGSTMEGSTGCFCRHPQKTSFFYVGLSVCVFVCFGPFCE